MSRSRYSQLAGWLGGDSRFELIGGPEFFTNLMQGYSIKMAAAGLTNPAIRNGFSACSSPTQDLTDTVTSVKGTHTFSFGGQSRKSRRFRIQWA